MRTLREIVAIILCLFVGTTQAQYVSKAKKDTVKTQLEDGVKLREVEVVGKRKFGVESSQMSAINLSQHQLTIAPTFMGETDVLKVLQKLPGVSSTGEGNAGIYVRGGSYDQNLITLDGATLYNPEHLKGYASAINGDMVGSLDFYRGAFPARYGSRLSSVVDVKMKEGDFKKFHGSLHLGMIAGGFTFSGPIFRNKTSFSVGGRLSYFKNLAYKALGEVYKDPKELKAYSNMRYYDVNAKIAHRFNERSKITASFYYGIDRDNSKPSKSEYSSKYYVVPWHPEISDKDIYNLGNYREDSVGTKWSNMCISLNWNWKINDRFEVKATGAYSKYDYYVHQYNRYFTMIENEFWRRVYYPIEYRYPREKNEMKSLQVLNQDYHSIVDDRAFDLSLNRHSADKRHNVLMGVNINNSDLNPQVSVNDKFDYADMRWDANAQNWYLNKKKVRTDTILGEKQNLQQYALYVEDDFTLNKNLRFNIGLRYALHSVEEKMYSSLEPRLSMNWNFLDKNAVKLSYSRMAQSTQRLATNNIKSTTELWVPITKDFPLMTSDLCALGYVYELRPGITASVEGYYKMMDGVMEYKQNANYAATLKDWRSLVSVGKGRTFGAEIFVEKTTGNTTGWVSYTWSKALRKFDRPDNILNGGKEFYALNDRRHNFNAVVTHKLYVGESTYFRFSGSWTYQSGRRGTLPVAQFLGGRFANIDGIVTLPASGDYSSVNYPYLGFYDNNSTHVYDALRAAITSNGINNYVLPAVHHLDLDISIVAGHSAGESIVSLNIYNVYNRMNVNTAYLSMDENNKLVLKGQCPFPIMPTLSYTHKF